MRHAEQMRYAEEEAEAQDLSSFLPNTHGKPAALCVCVCGGAGCWEGRAHVGERHCAWRGTAIVTYKIY
eukprot:scaffold62604_cov68-Phaeocystis_antarctica.AAC.6